jgi:hypothetical protein
MFQFLKTETAAIEAAKAPVGANPEAALFVFSEGVHVIAMQAVLCGVVAKASAIKLGQTATLRSQPEVAPAILQHGIDLRLRQPIPHGVLGEAVGLGCQQAGQQQGQAQQGVLHSLVAGAGLFLKKRPRKLMWTASVCGLNDFVAKFWFGDSIFPKR